MIPFAVALAGRAAALVAAVGWGISVAGLVEPSATAFDLLVSEQWLGRRTLRDRSPTTPAGRRGNCRR